jgi:hypothetical protein
MICVVEKFFSLLSKIIIVSLFWSTNVLLYLSFNYILCTLYIVNDLSFRRPVLGSTPRSPPQCWATTVGLQWWGSLWLVWPWQGVNTDDLANSVQVWGKQGIPALRLTCNLTWCRVCSSQRCHVISWNNLSWANGSLQFWPSLSIS